MTPDQLTLIDVPVKPKVTDRQQRALDLLQQAGHDGLTSDELGANFHRHSPDDRCLYCGQTGNELGKALRAKGLVCWRKRTAPGRDAFYVWTVADATPAAEPERGARVFTRPDGTEGDIPF